ncbi:hypothetical protein RR46_02313 [Papilio xuthus]|uniref:Uncharacterized protein n=1 Tax=Papilio xuthus TaxID=66420 RepID=A0A194QQI6_PAPXU|nr:hypothetical protein RR46_02313 [Papilio xuthus]
MQMLPGNINRPKYGHMNNGQRSYFRRETSPMSAYNVSHFSRPYYRSFSTRSHIGSHQSVYNRGNRSPASVRSLDSTATVTASDIVVALKNEHFSKYDQKLLKAACYKFLKNKSRKRLEYMRNRRILINKIRRRCSTEDLGEMASESSSSSENSVSPKIFKPKETNGKIIKNNVNQPCMANNSVNILDINQKQNENVEETIVAPIASNSCTYNSKENSFLLKDRFKKGFLLPSQRFSNSNNGHSTEINLSCNSNKNQVPDLIRQCSREQNENNSDEEIFSVPTNDKGPEKSQTTTRKRTIDCNEKEDNPKAPKQMKRDTPKKAESLNCVNNDFNFARPQMPITKFGKHKKKKAQPEILISKSSQPLSVINETVINNLSPIRKEPIEESTKQNINNTDIRSSINNESANTTNDVSKRPSFIKRKLFTQKLDIIEAKIDTPQSSPSVDKYVGNKEKTKPRKLASSQSCMSRDVAEDNNNLLNLLHKIVPAEQMSLINSTTNKPDSGNRKSDGDCAKWDIDSVLSTCNADDGSETYTDEEILANGKNDNRKSNDIAQQNGTSEEIEEIPQKNKANEKTVKSGIKDGNKNSTKTNQKTFWDTDIESDWESNVYLPYKLNNCQRSNAPDNQQVDKVNENNKSVAVNSLPKKINLNCLNVDAIKKTANNCQQSIWDTDFESDLESYGILPKKAGNCKTNNTTNNKNINQENGESNKNLPANSRAKKINLKSANIDVNKTVTNNYQKSIWDTDFESDLEGCGILPQAKKASKINPITANRKINIEEKCENKNSTVNSKTKNVTNPKSQKVDANKKTAKNQPKSIWDTDFESDMDLSNKSGICKVNETINKNGSNKENIQKNGGVAMQSDAKRIMIIKCQRINTNMLSNTGQKLISQYLETDSKNNKATPKKRLKKDDNVKENSPVTKTKAKGIKRTPTKYVQDKNVSKKKAMDIQKKNISPEPDNNISNVSGRWLRANRRANNSMNDLKAKDSLKTTLISHRMTRQKTKILNNSDITSTTIQPNVSTELNISVRSLRPRKKRVPKW